jgi:glycosyltransferase involved in cell wall biosynthesis
VSPPLVSIVIATWNAGYLLRYSLGSVLRSDLQDFEILVVGDHCTDDTEAVVASFSDARIRFVNLETNSGQQATPNNVGVGMARGEYLAFLNHDDMYLPQHLSGCVARMRHTGADILCCTYAVIPPQLKKLATRELAAQAGGFEPSGRFSPRTFHVASSWFMRREVADAVGPWRLERDTWVSPSQEWLFRAWRKGMRIECPRDISVVVLFAGPRRNFYLRRDSPEHEYVFRNVIETDRLRARVVEEAHAYIEAELRPRQEPWHRRLERRVRGLRSDAIARLLISVGIHPKTRDRIKRSGWRRGGWIRRHQEFTGSARSPHDGSRTDGSLG